MYGMPDASRRPVTTLRTSSSSLTAGTTLATLAPICDIRGHGSNGGARSISPWPGQAHPGPPPSKIVRRPALLSLAFCEGVHVLSQRDHLGGTGLAGGGQ